MELSAKTSLRQLFVFLLILGGCTSLEENGYTVYLGHNLDDKWSTTVLEFDKSVHLGSEIVAVAISVLPEYDDKDLTNESFFWSEDPTVAAISEGGYRRKKINLIKKGETRICASYGNDIDCATLKIF